MENFWCENRSKNPNCQHCNSKGDLQIDEPGEYICPDNEEIALKHMGKVVNGMFGPRMTKDQIKVDRKKRSSDHFKKEILPSLAEKSMEGKHFHQKYIKKR